MKVDLLLGTRLAVGETGLLFGVADDKLDLIERSR